MDINEILAAIKHDRYFKGQDSQAMEFAAVVGTFLAQIFEEGLDLPITFKSFIDAKIAANIFMVRILFPEKVSEVVESDSPAKTLVIPENQQASFFNLFADLMDEMLLGVSQTIIEQMSEISKDAPGYLEENGITEQQFFMLPQVNLSPSLKKAYKAGELTLRTLLLKQPSLVVANN